MLQLRNFDETLSNKENIVLGAPEGEGFPKIIRKCEGSLERSQ